MEQYLATTSNKLKTNNYSDLTIVMGNESCDLDSAVSAIVYAMFLNWQYEQIKCKVCTKDKRDETCQKDNIFVPLLDVAREDFELKTEVAHCLREHSVNEDNLVFSNDIDLKSLLTDKTSLVLVDHHVLAKKYEFLVPYITEVIDHRPIDKKEWKYKEDTRSTIETVGSCATLVGQRMKDISSLMKRDEFFTKYPVCCSLLYCTILLDTVNFSKEVNKGTPHDRDIVVFLETILKVDDKEVFRKTTVDKLVAARSDVTRLTPAQLLRKDVKVLGDVLVPSFPIPVKEFLKKPGALQAVSEALASRGCGVALLLGMRLTPSLMRDAAVYSINSREKANKLVKYLQDCTKPSFGLTVEVLAELTNCSYFRQNNLGLTRKQYVPVLNEFLQNYEE